MFIIPSFEMRKFIPESDIHMLCPDPEHAPDYQASIQRAGFMAECI